MSSPEHNELGQFIPLHYHFQMLADDVRMTAFESALEKVVPIGGRVLDLGSGTGIQSFFAARRAAHVTAVEFNSELAEASRRFLHDNGLADRVQVLVADASEFTPDEPVDVVVCEMLHSGLLREKQIDTIARFKEKYFARFAALPRFVPEATLLAAQPVLQEYRFHGYHAPVPLFQAATAVTPGCSPMAEPQLYAVVDYAQALPDLFEATQQFRVAETGAVNAIRFVTKNLLAILPEEQSSIDWHNHYLVMPLSTPLEVAAGDVLELRFRYTPGAPLRALTDSLDCRPIGKGPDCSLESREG